MPHYRLFQTHNSSITLLMNSKFLLRSLKPSDLLRSRPLLINVFTYNEPLSRYVGLSESSFRWMFDLLSPNIDYKTPIVAQANLVMNESTIDNDLPACFITTPLDAAIDETKLDKTTLPILDLILELESSFKYDALVPKSISESRVLHLAMGATREEFQGQGLLCGLMDEWSLGHGRS
ncbi:hypothetical protein BJ165DRAFT_1535126 [Panaeolus papilionaceus]|nr:hypothetical protein BJ165DRAFT_1535126 [Panaeolus papilionaceus]